MALWTDLSRQTLIQNVYSHRILWEKKYSTDQNHRVSKNEAFQAVTEEMNRLFNPKFSCEDIRSQWKNLKDTFVRKLRWVSLGKYTQDPAKEPTWKFYRMLSFLDDNETKRLSSAGDDGAHLPLDIAAQPNVTLTHHPINLDHIKEDACPSASSHVNYDTNSNDSNTSEEQMMQIFPDYAKSARQTSLHPDLLNVSTASSSGISNLCSRETNRSFPCRHTASSRSSNDTDDESRPKKKRKRKLFQCSSPSIYDEFELFGAVVASNLKRICNDHGRGSAQSVQRQISGILFSEQ